MTDHEQWLADRKKGIGGSDISAILGINKYKTPWDIWADKTGHSMEIQSNPRMRFGKKAEQLVVEYWEEETNLNTQTCEPLIHENYNFIRANPDRIYIDDQGKSGILECKTTKNMISPDDEGFMPYFCQLQWYMGITKSPVGEVAILERVDCNFKSFPFEFNEAFYNSMLEKAIYFWKNYVEANKAPEPMNINDIKNIYKSHISGNFIQAVPEVVKEVMRLKNIKNNIKELESEEEAISSKLKFILKENEGLTYNDEVLLTWKKANDSTKFDTDLFKKTNPDLFNQFLKPVPGSRRFLVK